MDIYTLASSSSGNATLVSHGGTHILIDAGISLRRIRDSLHTIGLTVDELAGVLITHAHSDHIGGVEMLVKYQKAPIYASRGTGAELCLAVPEVEPYVNCFDVGAELGMGDVSVRSFPTPHDAEDSVGYIIEAGGVKLAYVTDLGRVTAAVLDASLGADIAIVEANHDLEMLKNGSYPRFLQNRILSVNGHLSNNASAAFAAKLAHAGARKIVLAHLSLENNTPKNARQTVENALLESGAAVGRDVTLYVAPPNAMGDRFSL